MTEKIECHTPDEGRTGSVRIPVWKYECVRSAILDAIVEAGDEGVLFSDLPAIVSAQLSKEELAELGSVSWHATTVKLNMEVDGEITRMDGKGPQRLILKEN